MGSFPIHGLAAGVAPTDAANVSQITAAIVVPIGGVLIWPTGAAPASFHLLDGSAISRTTYAGLFALIGTTYGVGDGSTTFNLPAAGGRTIAAVDPSGTILTSATMSPNGNTYGATGGAETHALTTPELATHLHVNTASSAVTDPGHAHGYFQPNAPAASAGAGVAASVVQGSTGSNTGTNTTGITVATTMTNANAGSGTAHINVQPTLLMNYIMRLI